MSLASSRLVFDKVRRRFGKSFAISDFSLSVKPGEILCVLGRSGCGKTTILRLAAGLERVDSGSIAIDGEIVSTPDLLLPPERRGVGLLFQDFALFPHLTVAENVAFGLTRLPRAERLTRVRTLLGQVGLEQVSDAYPHRLSGGEQQRVALARALAPEPRILLMDEPFSSLDRSLREALRAETAVVLRTLGTTVLLVTHDAEEAMALGDRIALMRGGRLVQVGTPDEIYDHPADCDVARFFSEINVLEAYVKDGCAATALGRFDASAHPEGSLVEVLLRPQALTVTANGAGVPAHVIASRRLGAETLVELTLRGEGVAPQALKLRLPGGSAPPAGADIRLSVVPGAARVVACIRPAGGTDTLS